jgi:hypothetical protein
LDSIVLRVRALRPLRRIGLGFQLYSPLSQVLMFLQISPAEEHKGTYVPLLFPPQTRAHRCRPTPIDLTLKATPPIDPEWQCSIGFSYSCAP